MSWRRNFIFSLTIVLFGMLGVSCRQAYTAGQKEEVKATGVPSPTVPPSLEAMQYSFRQVAQAVLPVVVEINVIEVVSQQVPRFDSPWDFFFNPNPDDQSSEEREFRRPGLGSGVIVRRQGERYYVLTNNHVVGDASEISVRLNDRKEFKGKLGGRDPRRDLALVIFEAKENLPVAKLGNSEELQVGDLVLAVGNPFGFESTVTSGIVSALGRKAEPGQTIASFTDYIQTDAAINPGNSGGALANLKGEVVGINTWIASRTGSYMGLGFAVPIDNAKKAIDDFITKGKVEYGWLGVQIGDLEAELYPGFKEELKLGEQTGAFVFNLFKGSPADKAGILPGDFILNVNDTAVQNADQLTRLVGNLSAGNVSKFVILRGGSRLTVSTKIAIREEEKEISAQSKNLWPGMYVTRITDEIKSQIKLPPDLQGLIVRFVVEGTPSAIAGFKAGDVIRKINDAEIRGAGDFYQTLNQSKEKEVVMRILRQGSEVVIGLAR